MHQMNESILPRSKENRRAYVEGYVNALIDVNTSGIKIAKEWAWDMLNIERDADRPINSGTREQAERYLR